MLFVYLASLPPDPHQGPSLRPHVPTRPPDPGYATALLQSQPVTGKSKRAARHRKDWKSWKLIAQAISPTPSLFVAKR